MPSTPSPMPIRRRRNDPSPSGSAFATVVEDGSPGTITVFNANGTGREVVRLEPTGAVHWPFGIDVATNGDVAVAVRTAAGKGQIQFFDQKNRFLSRLNLDEYGGCADLAFDADGNLWVTSSRSGFDEPEGILTSWDVFDPDGHFIELCTRPAVTEERTGGPPGQAEA